MCVCSVVSDSLCPGEAGGGVVALPVAAPLRHGLLGLRPERRRVVRDRDGEPPLVFPAQPHDRPAQVQAVHQDGHAQLRERLLEPFQDANIC